MPIFNCKNCNNKFEASGNYQEWIDPTFGPCSKITSDCPSCGQESNEYQLPKQSKDKGFNNVPACGIQGGCRGCGGI
jgi:hypothetical protein